MPSELAWLDTAPADRRRALELLRLFEERGTVDELGIGTVRDAIADTLFPGTSTLHTRAAYFLLVPWVYQVLERRVQRGTVAPSAIPRDARNLELLLLRSILRSEDSAGAIGSSALDTLKILPSAMYWGGLREWGILRFPGSREQFHRFLARGAAAREILADSHEADSLVDDHRRETWDPELPQIPARFPEGEIPLWLDRKRAEYLRSAIVHRCPGTLLAHVVEHCEAVDSCDFPWEHPELAGVPIRLRDQLNHAECFAEVMNGAALFYNLLLARKGEADGFAKHAEWAERYAARWSEWVADIERMSGRIQAWNRDAFWHLVSDRNRRIPIRSRQFIEMWWDRVLGGSLSSLADAGDVRRVFELRETELKGVTLARLVDRGARHRWGGASGVGKFSYRWSPEVRQLTNDILTGLRN